MKFAQSSFVYVNYPLEQAIARLHELGYSGVEIWGGRRDSVNYMQSAIDNAYKLGAPSVSLCAGMTLRGESVEKGWANLRRSIVELLDYAGPAGVSLLIEPAHRAESTLILTVADGLRMIHEIGSDRLGICLDTGHANVNGEDLAQIVHDLDGVPFHVHIDDNGGGDDAHLIPGRGKIDYAPFVQALRETRYEGFVSAELGFQYALEPDAAVTETHRALSRMFES